ncbi:MAG: hypothetical protein VB130_11840 [Clostridium sp.]|nr:hypothetical protein [Clostridium sp.]
MATIKKSEIDLDLTLVKIIFIMKGFRQEIVVNTTAKESCDFVDWINNNTALNSYNKAEKSKFNNKFYTFDDYVSKRSITVNLQDIKCFSVPFYLDKGEEYDFKILEVR